LQNIYQPWFHFSVRGGPQHKNVENHCYRVARVVTKVYCQG